MVYRGLQISREHNTVMIAGQALVPVTSVLYNRLAVALQFILVLSFSIHVGSSLRHLHLHPVLAERRLDYIDLNMTDRVLAC